MTPEERQAKLKERAKQLRERELNDIKKVVDLPEGRRLLWRIMSEAGTFRNPFTGDQGTAFNAGKMAIGQIVFGDLIKAAPDKFMQAQREYRSEEVSFRKEIPPETDEE